MSRGRALCFGGHGARLGRPSLGLRLRLKISGGHRTFHLGRRVLAYGFARARYSGCGYDLLVGLFLQGPKSPPFMQRQAHGRDGCLSGGPRLPPCPGAPMGPVRGPGSGDGCFSRLRPWEDGHGRCAPEIGSTLGEGQGRRNLGWELANSKGQDDPEKSENGKEPPGPPGFLLRPLRHHRPLGPHDYGATRHP